MEKGKEVVVPAIYRPLYERQCRYRSVLYYGGRSGGKSTEVARAMLARAAAYPGTRIACLREFQASIKNSVKLLLDDQIEALGMAGFDSTREEIRNQNGSLFTFHGMHLNYDSLKGLESYDVAWIEEGQSVSAESLKWLIPTIRKAGSFIVVTMNRYSERDPAWVRFQPEVAQRALVRQVLYTDNQHLSREVLEEADSDRLHRPDEYRHIWLGEPITQAASCILSAQSISEAMHGVREFEAGPVRYGLDVARMGDDATVLSRAEGNRLVWQKERRKSSLDQTVDWVMGLVQKGHPIKVDDTGLGGGVTDYLKRHGHNVIPVNFGGRACDREHYDLVVDEMWFQFQDMQDTIILPDNSELYDELTMRQYGVDKYGRKRVQTKAEFKKILHRSPDRADSALLAFYEPRLTVPTIRTL